LFLLSLLVGIGAGVGAIGFRGLIAAVTQLVTGVTAYGLQRAPSLHLPWLGIWFLVLAPIAGGLLYGPLIHFFAREARGHGVPEVMLAVAENGGRIRPQVTVIKALASGICIGTGGSVGREGPIVQIGSALASTFGQVVRMPESRLRIIVACGAAGGISATFNAPLTGVFFGLELILREVSGEAFVAILLSSMAADVVGRAAFGSHPFLTLPAMTFPTPWDYLPGLALGLIAGFVGVGFSKALYAFEDACDRIWRHRPEWLRPAAMGGALGLLLLAMPQLFGVGYPVLQHAVVGGYVFWFLLALLLGKMVAASLTIGIGGSGGVFAPSLFIGAMLGAGYGQLLGHLFGPAVGPAGAYSMVAMGALFAGAARAPLTATSSVFEMTGDFQILLVTILATATATAVSTYLSHGTIYTTKLLRRGIDIERPKPATLMQQLTVADVMRPLTAAFTDREALQALVDKPLPRRDPDQTARHQASSPQAVFVHETLEQALRQLVLFGRAGLPVIADDGETIVGWITNQDVIRAVAHRLGQSVHEAEEGAVAADFATSNPEKAAHEARNPLPGFRVLSAQVNGWPGQRAVKDIHWPPGTLVVMVRRGEEQITPAGDTRLEPGDQLTILAPTDEAERVLQLVEGPAVR
jgi:CIC family chloride channel protein